MQSCQLFWKSGTLLFLPLVEASLAFLQFKATIYQTQMTRAGRGAFSADQKLLSAAQTYISWNVLAAVSWRIHNRKSEDRSYSSGEGWLYPRTNMLLWCQKITLALKSWSSAYAPPLQLRSQKSHAKAVSNNSDTFRGRLGLRFLAWETLGMSAWVACSRLLAA